MEEYHLNKRNKTYSKSFPSLFFSVIPMFDTDILKKFWRIVFLGHLPSSPTSLFLHHLAIDVLPWVATFLGSLFLGLEYGILIGVGISILPLLWLVARPPVTTSDE